METIAAAAFRSPRSGEISADVDHSEAFYKSDIYRDHLGAGEGALKCAIASMTEDEHFNGEGFLTSAGRFVDRQEAAEIARQARQVSPSWGDSGEYLLSEDLEWMEDYSNA